MALRTDRGWHRRSDNVGYGWCHESSENTAASQDEDPATLTHQGKPNCTVTATIHLQKHKAKEKISPNFKMSTGKLPRHKICRRKLI